MPVGVAHISTPTWPTIWGVRSTVLQKSIRGNVATEVAVPKRAQVGRSLHELGMGGRVQLGKTEMNGRP